MARETKLTKDERRRQREQEPPEPLHDDATDPEADEPHHAISNPASEPNPTEFPDPYERRADPRDPGVADTATPRPPSTSDPHPPRNYDELKPVKGDNDLSR